jgi:D-methionine transport system ATP-binding protein
VGNPQEEPFIVCKGVIKEFQGTRALSHVHLTIPKGAIFGIIGTSGAGKSTLMRCLCGLEIPTAGAIWIGKDEVSGYSPYDWRMLRRKIGFIFQHFNLFSSRTALENVTYPLEVQNSMSKRDREARALELLALVGMVDKRHSYPSQLSGGEKQRVGIARALALNPEILFCDEPTSALDSATGHTILQLLQKLNETLSVTIVIITHQVEAVKRICTHAAVMDRGIIVEQGSVLDLCTHPSHAVTQNLLEPAPKVPSSAHIEGMLVKLCFSGGSARKPLISEMIKTFDVEVNILGGNLEEISETLIGNLLINITGEKKKMAAALQFLEVHDVFCEVLHDS